MTTRDDRQRGSQGYSDDAFFATERPERDEAYSTSERQRRLFGTEVSDTGDAARTSLSESAVGVPYSIEDTDDRPPRLRWNGGLDFGLFLLRLTLGAVFVVRGVRKLFGVLDGVGPAAFASELAELGFRQTKILSLVTGGVELGAGALLVVGLLSPVAAAALLSVLINSVVLKWGRGIFLDTGVGWEYSLVLAGIAGSLLFTGPGRISLDRGLPWYRRPVLWGLLALLVGCAASAVTLFVLRDTPLPFLGR